MNHIKKITRVVVVALVSLVSPIAFAASTSGPGSGGSSGGGPPIVFTSIGAVTNKVCDVFYWIFTAAIIISVIMILLAAIKYMTGGGFITKGSGSEAITSARKDLWYAVIGIVIAMLAKVTPSLIGDFLGSGPYTVCLNYLHDMVQLVAHIVVA